MTAVSLPFEEYISVLDEKEQHRLSSSIDETKQIVESCPFSEQGLGFKINQTRRLNGFCVRRSLNGTCVQFILEGDNNTRYFLTWLMDVLGRSILIVFMGA
jgi:hypothetical protein